METTSRVATLAVVLGLAGAAAFALGPAGIHLGAFTPFVGFRIFTLGLLLGLLALLLGLTGLWRTRASAGRAGRGRAWVGTALGFALIAIVLVAVAGAGNAPVINDITTDPNDPPRFTAAREIPENAGRDLSYPGASFAAQQREGYPDLVPIRVAAKPEPAQVRAETAAAQLGWEITWSDADVGVFEAVDVSPVFLFVDDIVVRVRPTEGGSIVDVRSKSRDGRGDMGANASRIRAFRDALGR